MSRASESFLVAMKRNRDDHVVYQNVHTVGMLPKERGVRLRNDMLRHI